jgi:hypothetical protein
MAADDEGNAPSAVWAVQQVDGFLTLMGCVV